MWLNQLTWLMSSLSSSSRTIVFFLCFLSAFCMVCIPYLTNTPNKQNNPNATECESGRTSYSYCSYYSVRRNCCFHPRRCFQFRRYVWTYTNASCYETPEAEGGWVSSDQQSSRSCRWHLCCPEEAGKQWSQLNHNMREWKGNVEISTDSGHLSGLSNSLLDYLTLPFHHSSTHMSSCHDIIKWHTHSHTFNLV